MEATKKIKESIGLLTELKTMKKLKAKKFKYEINENESKVALFINL